MNARKLGSAAVVVVATLIGREAPGGMLTQIDASGVHVLASSGVVDAALAFAPAGEVLDVVTSGGVLTQIDASGAHVLASSDVQGVGVAFGPAGQVLLLVSADATPPVLVAAPAFDWFGWMLLPTAYFAIHSRRRHHHKPALDRLRPVSLAWQLCTGIKPL